jgi:predicted nucleic acid-binding protein
MAGELLLDTGGLVSLLDRSQSYHAEFARFFQSWKGPVVSTEAVLTEASHLLARVPDGPRACCDFFLEGGAVLVPSSPLSLRRCRELVDLYHDLPMDYADATLVTLAEELDTSRILTTDRRDFSVYRIHGRKKFRIEPNLPSRKKPTRRSRT